MHDVHERIMHKMKKAKFGCLQVNCDSTNNKNERCQDRQNYDICRIQYLETLGLKQP